MNYIEQVIAVVPNYNMGNQLRGLLPQLLAEDYDAIYVLDDASTDNSVAVARSFGARVTVIEGRTNKGSGGNRNRILSALETDAIIHFLDADVELLTHGIPNIARELMSVPNTGFIGGQVKNKDGSNMMWNFGPRMSLYASWTSFLQYVWAPATCNPTVLGRLWHKFTRPFLSAWPDIAVPFKRRPVFWVAEANMLIRRNTLEQLGGFDDAVRENDIFEPAQQAYNQGLVTIFDPSICVRHLEVDVRHYNRELARRRSMRYLVRKHGHLSWLFPDGHFKPKVNTP